MSLGRKIANLFRSNKKSPNLRLVVTKCSDQMAFKKAGPHSFQWRRAEGAEGTHLHLVHIAWEKENGRHVEREYCAVRRMFATFFYRCDDCKKHATRYTISKTGKPHLFQIQSQSASGKGSVKCMTVNFFLSRVSSQACGGAFCYREQLWKKVPATAAC
jgi:hypothetical protein